MKTLSEEIDALLSTLLAQSSRTMWMDNAAFTLMQAKSALERNERDADLYHWLWDNREVMLLTGFFGNGCVNRTREQVEAAIDSARAGGEGNG